MARRMRGFLALLAACWMGVAAAQTGPETDGAAPGPALLVADSVFVEGEDRLVATGAVEAFFDGFILRAAAITYDRGEDRLQITGPLRIVDDTGRITILADSADLDTRLQDGILAGARVVLDDQLQMAAASAERIGGRYTALTRVAVTSCQICAEGAVPLWQIRAQSVIHDTEARQIYLSHAQLRVLDVPVFYLPRMRLPDPTLERARGFLVPTLRSTSRLGAGIKIPYFIPIGPHRDLTLTPYLSPETQTLEARYRQAFRRGNLTFTGAISQDSLRSDGNRWYLFAQGEFGLPRDLQLDFDLKTVSDAAYLDQYGISGDDRLASSVGLGRVRDRARFDSELVYYDSLRDSEDNETQPTRIAAIRTERRLRLPFLPGMLHLGAEAQTHARVSESPVDGPDDDTIADGRDISRLHASVGLENRWTLAGGLRAEARGILWLDQIDTRQDAGADPRVRAMTPGAAVALRYPLLRRGAGGARTLIEPIAQLAWVGGSRPGNPNDESTRVEFDEGNLLDLSRFPAADRREYGGMLATGLRMTHAAPAGWDMGLTLGHIWRNTTDPDFSRSSGLDGASSDLLIAGRFANASGLSLLARGLLDGSARFSKAEARVDWSNARLDLGASYLLLLTDPAEDRGRKQSEWTLDGTYRINPRWQTGTEVRYDLSDGRLDRVELGLQYRNECVEVALSANRRLASSTSLEPTTDFTVTVSLLGFSAGATAGEIRRQC